jgi:hypothetical protein
LRKRLGEERVYATDFGEQTFCIGEVLVGRERAHGGVNGDLYTLAAHRDDGRLELVPRRDGATVLWDPHEHRAIDHGYATTSYRSQGRTVDAVFALTSSAEARRGLYVDGRLREERGARFRRALSARAAGQWQGTGCATCSATWASAKKLSPSADRKKSGFAQRRSNLNEGKRSTEDRKSTAAMRNR